MGFRRSLVRIQSPRHKPQGAKQPRVAANLAAPFFPARDPAGQASRAGLKKSPHPLERAGAERGNRPGTPLWWFSKPEPGGFPVNHRKPWYRKSKDAWYVEIAGRQRLLGKHPEGAPAPKKSPRTGVWNAPQEIQAAFRRLIDSHEREEALKANPSRTLARDVCDRFLDSVCPYLGQPPDKQPKASEQQPALKPDATHDVPTYWWYRKYLRSFCDLHGYVRVVALKPLHLTEWLDAHPGWKASRRHAIIAVKRCFKWGEDEGLVDRSPFRGVKKPPVGRRDRIL